MNIKKINIYVENQGTIKAMISHRITSENVLRSRQAVDIVAVRKRLHMYMLRSRPQKNFEKRNRIDEIAKSAIGYRTSTENTQVAERQIRVRWIAAWITKIICKRPEEKHACF